MAEQWEQKINNALKDQIVANAAVIGIRKDGKTLISKTYGNLSVSSTEPIKLDTPMWIASCTKLLTSIAALQFVKAGKLSLTAPVHDILPELRIENLEILSGFTSDDPETGKPILSKPSTPITLTMLLSHSSGLSYDLFNPMVKRYRDYLGLPPALGGVVVGEGARLSTLLFEPGTGWEYSIGIDWAGLMVERVSGLNLEEYFIQHIFKPLGMKDTTLDPFKRDDAWKARMIGRVLRDSTTGKVRDMTAEEPWFGLTPFRPGRGGGGGGCYSTTEDYSKVLRSLLMDDGVLLEKGSIEMFTQGRLSEKGKKMLRDGLVREWNDKNWSDEPGAFEALEWDYALGGGVRVTAVEGLNESGVMFWGGMMNNSWYLDVKAGTAGFHGTWIYPNNDLPTARLADSFQRAVYELAQKDP